jgi:hypothetical protein
VASFRITDEHTPDDLGGKHIVVNCRTGEIFAADTDGEAAELAEAHNRETAELLAQEEDGAE